MFGFNTAVQGLLASQRSLYITNHNISNMNTEGYSRQQGAQRATNPQSLPGIGFLGTGTEIYNVERIRDSYVDFKYWNENASTGEWSVKVDTLGEMEKLFGEPSDSSFRQYLDDFYTALDNMSKNSSDSSFREPVVENALALTKHINETAKRLQNLREETEFSIETKIENVNSLANQIASLNRQIYSNELDGRPANDLRDRRELLVDKLSKIANVKVDESKDGKYRVNISGVSIVDHIDVNEISWSKNEDKLSLQWSNGSEVKIKSGELKGVLDLYNGDGQNSTYRGIQYYQDRLDNFAKGFAEGFNEQHKLGYGLNGETNINFFVGDGGNTNNITAIDITVSEQILNDLDNIAAAKNAGGSAEDNGNLLELIDQRDRGEHFGFNSSPDDFIKSIMSNLAVDSMQGQRMHESQNLILKNIESKRNSISGVSYDEEMANMVKFQNTYVASARMITTMDAVMDVTINRLGLVGR
ncbi:flagellar hook-associated protein FlgK [Schnuerera sp. xch1]|uniref:flagellar hook-associated protein FlgK n=1 Tax=Schnuerera sp. xch1 TaxID=2874283 RepID=UPI001CBE9073|nr:flagellar hook-associated protein FlgK [Schnuerera sp. xch1]MBZ2174822.1 flagellar hook-associated protein FlgK [Schnuerera sp. xch1]